MDMSRNITFVLMYHHQRLMPKGPPSSLVLINEHCSNTSVSQLFQAVRVKISLLCCGTIPVSWVDTNRETYCPHFQGRTLLQPQ